MNGRDLTSIIGIAVLLLAAVSGVEMALRGLPEVPQEAGNRAAAPSLSVDSRSNVRAGDSTEHPVIGKLQVGESATILGISRGSAGWYYVELPDGARGFISPEVVLTDGDLKNLATIDPAGHFATASPLPHTPQPTQPAAAAMLTDEPGAGQSPTATASG